MQTGRSVPASGLQHSAVHTGISSELGEAETFQTSFQSSVVRMNYFSKEMTGSCVVFGCSWSSAQSVFQSLVQACVCHAAGQPAEALSSGFKQH